MSEMVPLHGFGGSDNLKFRVYAATSLPASGRENDVVVITSTPITYWNVYPNTYDCTTNGYVIIQNQPNFGEDDPYVNIVNKKNGYICLYFVKCWQVIDGKWVPMEAYQYRNGAWVQFSTTFKATIHITYPAGSTCTATDGTTTLSAPDTIGTWDCTVPNSGTWTVSCTDGTRNKQIEIAISEDGQSASAVLQYELYLYKTGDQCTVVTGGWKANNANEKITFNSDYIGFTYSGTSDRWANILTQNKISLSGYSLLNIDIEITANGESFWWGASADAVSNAKDKPSDVLANGSTGGTMARGVLSLDVSAIDTSGYVCFSALVVAGKIYNVWLS